MPRTTCTICGWVEPLWLDPPPAGCFDGGRELCQRAKDEAYARAMRRKIVPEAFDENGNLKKGGPDWVFPMVAAGYDPETGLPLPQAPEGGDG